MRKDLIWRISKIKLDDLDVFELIKNSEKFYDQFLKYYKKIPDIFNIEYANLHGRYKFNWYKNASKKMKFFFVANILLLFILSRTNIEYTIYITLMMFVFVINIIVLKKLDESYLESLAIRYFYDDWGFCVSCAKKIEFVGNIEMIEVSKYHHFIHSILDIAAFNRAIYMKDKFYKTNVISLVSKNMLELTSNYQSKNKNWVQYIPLWITALFDYDLNGEIEFDICKKFQECCENEYERECINVFLYSFWTYITRVMPADDKSSLVFNFMKYIERDREAS
ncbi:MAG: hypothetical protein ACLTC4_02315 [Hungatella hathewayi]|uniref:Uncharacterized protein n=2 Tax=Hungatella hathewayi TaxID=154046 RepID=G5IJM2_9FIRM|nr:hypothetical protein HMPREF9473_03700 [ [Hungatella hathewayi WAL-18680]